MLAQTGKPIRSEAYKHFVREHTCVVPDCRGRAQAAHIGPHAFGAKASDLSCAPCCAAHHVGHQGLHALGRERFEQVYGVDFSAIITELQAEYLHRYPSRAIQETPGVSSNPIAAAGCSIQDLMRNAEALAWAALGREDMGMFAHFFGEHRNLSKLLPTPQIDPFVGVVALGKAMAGIKVAA